MSVAELLVALAVTGFIAAATLTIALSGRGMLETDQHRTTVNQNLRAGLDLVGIDVRQAGERLPGDAPAVEIEDGAGGAPDVLTLRRNLLDYVLPLCKDINAGTNADSVFVAKKKGSGTVPPGCAPVPDENGDDWPDNLEAWREYRIAHGGLVTAYIYNPVGRYGEFFLYDAEDNSTFHLHKDNDEDWQFDYDVAEKPRIYILEQLAFRLSGDVLQSVTNGDTANPFNLVNRIRDFQVLALMSDDTVRTALGPADSWTELRALEVTLVGAEQFAARTLERTVAARFFPRNILSN
jgi:type IV pilus assembly protein PilW